MRCPLLRRQIGAATSPLRFQHGLLVPAGTVDWPLPPTPKYVNTRYVNLSLFYGPAISVGPAWLKKDWNQMPVRAISIEALINITVSWPLPPRTHSTGVSSNNLFTLHRSSQCSYIHCLGAICLEVQIDHISDKYDANLFVQHTKVLLCCFICLCLSVCQSASQSPESVTVWSHISSQTGQQTYLRISRQLLWDVRVCRCKFDLRIQFCPFQRVFVWIN